MKKDNQYTIVGSDQILELIEFVNSKMEQG